LRVIYSQELKNHICEISLLLLHKNCGVKTNFIFF
jgi:hypothetical protein